MTALYVARPRQHGQRLRKMTTLYVARPRQRGQRLRNADMMTVPLYVARPRQHGQAVNLLQTASHHHSLTCQIC